jgi:hypothetical protein
MVCRLDDETVQDRALPLRSARRKQKPDVTLRCPVLVDFLGKFPAQTSPADAVRRV